MLNWIKSNKKGIIRAMFLIPILSVAVISISHVVSWYSLANPISWAIYLSIAIEIAAMSSIAAASAKVKGFSVWFVFIIVTLVQFIGNIFFCYSEIDVATKSFKDWSELTAPVFEMLGSDVSDTIAQRRWLALLEGGLLPLISLTCLHFFIKQDEIDNIESEVKVTPEIPEVAETVIEEVTETIIETPQIEEKDEEIVPETIPNVVQMDNNQKKTSDVLGKALPQISDKMKKIHNK